VLLDPGRDREHVRVEDDVVRREARLSRQDAEGALGDLDLPLDARRLACSSNAMTTTAAPWRLTVRAWR
jgi:hypothetical protein